jgi:hypothetical protein
VSISGYYSWGHSQPEIPNKHKLYFHQLWNCSPKIKSLSVQHNYILFFMFCWPCVSIYSCKKNQLEALFILTIFSSINLYMFRAYLQPIINPARTTDIQLKRTINTNCCIYTVYLLMMGYIYAQNMQRLIDENILRINGASSWFYYTNTFYLYRTTCIDLFQFILRLTILI